VKYIFSADSKNAIQFPYSVINKYKNDDNDIMDCDESNTATTAAAVENDDSERYVMFNCSNTSVRLSIVCLSFRKNTVSTDEIEVAVDTKDAGEDDKSSSSESESDEEYDDANTREVYTLFLLVICNI
jgi:hypothetical protein